MNMQTCSLFIVYWTQDVNFPTPHSGPWSALFNIPIVQPKQANEATSGKIDGTDKAHWEKIIPPCDKIGFLGNSSHTLQVHVFLYQ